MCPCCNQKRRKTHVPIWCPGAEFDTIKRFLYPVREVEIRVANSASCPPALRETAREAGLEKVTAPEETVIADPAREFAFPPCSVAPGPWHSRPTPRGTAALQEPALVPGAVRGRRRPQGGATAAGTLGLQGGRGRLAVVSLPGNIIFPLR